MPSQIKQTFALCCCRIKERCIPVNGLFLFTLALIFMKQVFLAISTLLTTVLFAQQPARITVYKKTFTTYPFSDPDPVPNPSAGIYPYNRFDGYTNTPVQKEWKVVELENDFIRVMILPEIGGKVWSAVEKKSGKEFIYYNHVVKFRDVAMRGPWTSGGIESNFGTIGHTPNCSTPVDFTTITQSDGSVSCIVGALDLLTRTPWRIDINLPADKAYFTTRSFWFNASGIEQPYYHWMNAGIKVSGNLEYVYPGTSYIGHEGEVGEWPVNTKNGKVITWYNNNNFGGYKSYHVFGKYSNFFGGYWHDDHYGVVRYSDHDDKPGKKLWIWGLSRQGMIWENLMTDTDGQYTEIQSGRLFNQSAEASALTPFKHRGFAPYATDSWTEYWYPVMDTKGYVFANQYAALNVKQESGWLKIYLSPVQSLTTQLTVTNNGKRLYQQSVSLSPLAVFTDSIQFAGTTDQLQVQLGDGLLVWNAAPDSGNLSRPTATPAGIDNNSMYGLYLQGKNSIYFRRYALAEEKLLSCLEKDGGFVPALTDMSMLLYRKMNYTAALDYAKKALGINTYDPAANYYYGLINKKLGRRIDAIDGFDIATQSEEYRTPAFTELAKMYFSASGNNEKAIHYAQKALVYNQQNMDALQVLAVAYRLQNKRDKAVMVLNTIQRYDPLSSFVPFEGWLWDKTDAAKTAFIQSLQNEMPEQSCLELGLWYYSLGLTSHCVQALQLYPAIAEIDYWLAWLHKGTPEEQTWYNRAKTATIQAAFPFRPESAVPLRWYAQQSKEWQPVYMLALVEGACGNTATAAALFNSCGDQPTDAAFYAARAMQYTTDSAAIEKDLSKAISLDKTQWRFQLHRIEFLNKKGRYTEALRLAQTWYQQHPSQYMMGMLLAKTWMLNNRFDDAAKLLDKIVVIPYEGATDGHRLYKEAHLMLAIEAMKGNNYKKAITAVITAKQWPERLGAGKPYDDDLDERLENFLLYQCYKKTGNTAEANAAMQRIKVNKANIYKVNAAITEWANNNTQVLDTISLGLTDENSRILAAWRKL